MTFPRFRSLVLLLALLAPPILWGAQESGKAAPGSSPVLGMASAGPAASTEAASSSAQRKSADYISEGTRYYEAANIPEALKCYQQALGLDSSNAQLRALVEDTRACLDYQRSVQSRLTGDPAGRQLAVKEKYKKAQALFDSKDYGAARQEFFEVWLAAGNYGSTRAYLTRINQVTPAGQGGAPVGKTREATVQLASAEAAESGAGADEKAEAQQRAKRIESLLDSARQYAKEGEFDKARSECEEARKLDPENRGVLKEIAKIRKTEENAVKAKEDAARRSQEEERADAVKRQAETERQARDLKDKQVADFLAQAKEYSKKKDYEKAIQACDMALGIDPGNSKAQKARDAAGKAMQRAGEDTLAEKDQADARAREEALRKEETLKQQERKSVEAQVEGLIAEAKKQVKAGEYDQALLACQEALKLDPENGAALKLVPSVQREKQAAQEKADADNLRLQQRALEERVQSLLDEAKTSGEAGEYDKALGYCSDALKLAPENRAAVKLQASLEKDKTAKADREREETETRARELADQQAREQAAAEKAAAEQAREEAKAKALAEKEAEAKALAEKSAAEKAREEAIVKALAEKEAQAKALTEKAAAEQVRQDAIVKALAEKEAEAKALAEKSAAEKATAGEAAEQARKEAEAKAQADLAAEKAKQDAETKAAAEKDAEAARAKALAEPDKETAPKQEAATPPAQQEAKKLAKGEIVRSLRNAEAAYSKKDLATAREIWTQILESDPANRQAKVMLDQTAEAYQAQLADAATRKQAEEKEKTAEKKMNTPINLSTDTPVPLRELRTSLEILSDLDIYVAQGGEAMINVTFVDKPLHEVLDTILPPIGLKWSRKGDVITISADLQTKCFQLTVEEIANVDTLMKDLTLQKLLWGEEGKPPLTDTVLRLEERKGFLLIHDSEQNIKKLGEFLAAFQKGAPQEIVTKMYKIRKEKGEELKALIEAILRTDLSSPLASERKAFLVGENLIVRATRDDFVDVEKLLNDKAMLAGLESNVLSVAAFVIVPREDLQKNPELAKEFFDRVVEVVETMLYAQEGKEKARQEGRRLWTDPTVKQITITDRQDRIATVSAYLQSLPQIEQKERREYIFLKYMVATDAIGEIQQALGLAGTSAMSATGTGAGEQEVTLNTNARDMKDVNTPGGTLGMRLRRVNQVDVANDRDDTCELIVNTATQSMTVTLDEAGQAQFVEDWQFQAIDVRPSGTGATNSTQGTARVRIRYSPVGMRNQQGGGGMGMQTGMGMGMQPGMGMQTGMGMGMGMQPGMGMGMQPGMPGMMMTPGMGMTGEEPPFEILPFGKQNAIVVVYTDPADLARVQELVGKLDLPEKQVDVETLFVTVNEARAKEFGNQMTVTDRSDPRNYGFALMGLDTVRGAGLDQKQQVFGDTFNAETPVNTVSGSYGPTEATLVSMVLKNVFGYYVNNNLRLLEAEGVVSYRSGPHILVTHEKQARFEVTTRNLSPVASLQFTPQITSPDSIILEDLVVEMYDPAGFFPNPYANFDQGAAAVQTNTLNSILGTQGTTGVTGTGTTGTGTTGTGTTGTGTGTGTGIGTGTTGTGTGVGTTTGINLSGAKSTISTEDTWQNFYPYGISGAWVSPSQMWAATERKYLDTRARIKNGGTLVLGGWTGSVAEDLTGGVPGLRNLPWLGKLFFSRNKHTAAKQTLLIFLSGQIVD